jgi:type IV pilus assembly protein PilC
MLFRYQALDTQGRPRNGNIEAINEDIAISSLQRRGLIVSAIRKVTVTGSGLNFNINIFQHVSNKDIVILSRQLSTLFQAQVSALRVFRLLGDETENPLLRQKLATIAGDLQAGSSIAASMEKHPDVFDAFYVAMIKAGEESGKLDETFSYLADYLERTYELVTKARGALIYPAFVVFTFITVMILMFTVVIPKIAVIIADSGQEIPIYTKIVMGFSNFLVSYGIVLLVIAVVLGFFAFRFLRTPGGRQTLDEIKLTAPLFSTLFKKLYLSRLSDNMNTMLTSGIPMVRALELTAAVINNVLFQNILNNAVAMVKSGKPVSEALGNNKYIPGIMIQMIKVGEETGELGNILKTLARFYAREVSTTVDALVDLIEPLMIVMLGLGVAFLLASVLVPIYNISAGQ